MSRGNYWSSSRLAKFLRAKFGLPKLKSGTSKQWREWRVESQKKAPFIHWLTDKFFNKAQDFFCWPKDKLWDLRSALKARYKNKYHYLPTRLNPWRYHEVDNRMLHGLFETLVDFVEIEKAWMHVIWGQEENQKKFGYKWFELHPATNWLFDRRHPEAGIAYLNWEMSLKWDDGSFGNHQPHIDQAKADGTYNTPTNQAKSAKEQFELYNWWKVVRPNRPDAMDASGLTKYYEEVEEQNGGDFLECLGAKHSTVTREEFKAMHDKCARIEKEYDAEDEEMMIRLVKIRQALWT